MVFLHGEEEGKTGSRYGGEVATARGGLFAAETRKDSRHRA